MAIRISKYLADSGIASRRAAEDLIMAGRISINGVKIDSPVNFVNDGDTVYVDGMAVEKATVIRVIALNKPEKIMTTASDPDGRQTVYDILPPQFKNFKYIGRLDYMTTGLLLLTNSGELSRKLTLPSSNIKRTYIAQVKARSKFTFAGEGVDCEQSEARRGSGKSVPSSVNNKIAKLNDHCPVSSCGTATPSPAKGNLDRARKGITIDGVGYRPMDIIELSPSGRQLQITIVEGKKNEIRRVFGHIGLPVVKLKRISYGDIELGRLKPGEWRELKQEELECLI